MMDVTFRLAGVKDVELLLEFMREFYEHEGLAFEEGAAREALGRILSDGSLGRVWVIEVDAGAVGYVVLTLGFSLEFRGRDAFVDEFYVREGARGRGVGRRTLEFVEGQCAGLGVRALHLEVERGNTAAQGLYRGFGFRDHDRYLMTKRVDGST